MDLFLLLTALIGALTGTAKTVVLRAPDAVVAERWVSAAAANARGLAVRALATVRARPVAMRSCEGPAIELPMLRPIAPALAAVPVAPERRRE